MKKVYMLMAAAVMALTASAELNSAKTLDASVAPVEFEVTTATVNPFELKASSGDFSMKSLRDVTEFKIEQAPNRANASKLPIGDWMEKGTVEYTDDFLTSFYSDITPMTFEVAIEESFSTPGLYRLVDPYKAFAEANGFEYNGPAYIVIHAENEDAVYIETSLAGIVLPNYGEMIVMSDAALSLEAGYTLEQLMQYGVCGTYKNGVIKFPSSVLYVSAVNLGNQMAYGNTNGAFKVKFPGAKDYSLQVLTTECVVDNTIIVGFEVGEDVAAVKYGILTGGIYGFTEDNYQYIAEKGTEASNAVMQIELSAEDPAGRYTVLAAALDADGNYVAGDGTLFYNVIDNPEEWVSHGQGVYG